MLRVFVSRSATAFVQTSMLALEGKLTIIFVRKLLKKGMKLLKQQATHSKPLSLPKIEMSSNVLKRSMISLISS